MEMGPCLQALGCHRGTQNSWVGLTGDSVEQEKGDYYNLLADLGIRSEKEMATPAVEASVDVH